MSAATSPNPPNPARDLRRSTDVETAAAWDNPGMRPARVLTDRHRRTEAVIEMLRRRAELRRARADAVPPALRRAIDDSDRHGPADRPALRPGPE
jgi:hypothetical protein